MSDKNMIAGRYMVVTSLGTGGMADVFLAIDTILNREVAVKVLRGDSGKDPINLLRFQREASAVSKLSHPNVVEVYDIGEFDGRNYIVMEYVRGKTLKQLIRQRGALDKEEAVGIMKQLVAAVEHAHENNIIHRDIKPQNVLVKDDGTIKITDFGIALAHDAIQLTQSDSVLGSAHYIAPETTRGESATVQIDIYALGIVFYELLTGSVPFCGDNPVQIAMKHMREDLPSVREFNASIPQSIDNIIIRATVKNRVHRYQTAKDMLFDLDMCLMSEFANVEKVIFQDDDTNDHTVVFDNSQTGAKAGEKQTKETVNKKKKPKNRNRKIAAIIAVIVLLIGGTTLGIYYSNAIDGFGPTQFVEVPDVSGLSESAAKAKIEAAGLKMNTEVKTEVTDSIETGKISKQSPKKYKKVAKDSEVTITLSSGNYYVIGDYVGKDIKEVEAELEANGIKVIRDEIPTSEYNYGYIISQDSLDPGTKIKPGVERTIRLKIAVSIAFTIPDLIDMKTDAAKGVIESLGGKVVLVQEEMPKEEENDDLTEEEKKAAKEARDAKKGKVIRQSHAPYTEYTQTGDSAITLYYY